MIQERWEPTLEELEEAINFIEQYFEKAWLYEEGKLLQEKPKNVKKFTHRLAKKPHPLVPIYHDSLKNLENIKQSGKLIFDSPSLQLISLFNNLNQLKKIGTLTKDESRVSDTSLDRFKERLKSSVSYYETIYEIQIAVALARQGFSTWFIQESTKQNEKTPDILVKFRKQKFYIECKYQGETSKEELYVNAFKEFYWRAMQIMFKSACYYLICVEWKKDPTIVDIKAAITSIEGMVSKKQNQAVETDIAKINMDFLASGDQEFDTPFNFDYKKYSSDKQHIDLSSVQANFGIFNSVQKVKNPTIIIFRNIEYLDALVNGAVNDLNKAYSQIPEKGPSIVFLENRISFSDEPVRESASVLQQRIEGKLNIISRVNMVVLTRSAFVQRSFKGAAGIFRTVETKRIPNLKPACMLDEEVLNKFSYLKYY